MALPEIKRVELGLLCSSSLDLHLLLIVLAFGLYFIESDVPEVVSLSMHGVAAVKRAAFIVVLVVVVVGQRDRLLFEGAVLDLRLTLLAFVLVRVLLLEVTLVHFLKHVDP